MPLSSTACCQYKSQSKSWRTRLVCTSYVDLENQVPVFFLHVLEANVTQDPGIVDQDMYASKALDGSLNNCLAILDAVVVCNSLSSCTLDLLYHNIGSLCIQCQPCFWQENIDYIPLMTFLHLWSSRRGRLQPHSRRGIRTTEHKLG